MKTTSQELLTVAKSLSWSVFTFVMTEHTGWEMSSEQMFIRLMVLEAR